MPLVEAGIGAAIAPINIQGLIVRGPTLQCQVGFLDPSQPGCDGLKVVSALVDSGAGMSCIDIALATELGLPAVDQQSIGGAGGLHNMPVFMGRLEIPSLDFSELGRFTGVDLAGGGQSHGVLIGRSSLARMIMIYDGIRGNVTIATAKK